MKAEKLFTRWLQRHVTVIVRQTCRHFEELCQTTDDQLFNKAISNSNHVLHTVLPPPSIASQHYSVRRPTHTLSLPEHVTQFCLTATLWLVCCTSTVTKFLALCFFLPARRYASAGLCYHDVSGRLSVRLSVRHTPVLCLAERKQDREMYTIW